LSLFFFGTFVGQLCRPTVHSARDSMPGLCHDKSVTLCAGLGFLQWCRPTW